MATPGETAQVTVPADQAWTESGLYLEPGTYRFEATGEWRSFASGPARTATPPGGMRWAPSNVWYSEPLRAPCVPSCATGGPTWSAYAGNQMAVDVPAGPRRERTDRRGRNDRVRRRAPRDRRGTRQKCTGPATSTRFPTMPGAATATTAVPYSSASRAPSPTPGRRHTVPAPPHVSAGDVSSSSPCSAHGASRPRAGAKAGLRQTLPATSDGTPRKAPMPAKKATAPSAKKARKTQQAAGEQGPARRTAAVHPDQGRGLPARPEHLLDRHRLQGHRRRADAGARRCSSRSTRSTQRRRRWRRWEPPRAGVDHGRRRGGPHRRARAQLRAGVPGGGRAGHR